jgi:hypothetical protein
MIVRLQARALRKGVGISSISETFANISQ